MKVNGRLSNQGRFDAQLDNCYFAWLGAPRAGSQSATNGPRLSLWVPGEFIEGITFGMTLTAQSGHEFTVPRIPTWILACRLRCMTGER